MRFNQPKVTKIVSASAVFGVALLFLGCHEKGFTTLAPQNETARPGLTGGQNLEGNTYTVVSSPGQLETVTQQVPDSIENKQFAATIDWIDLQRASPDTMQATVSFVNDKGQKEAVEYKGPIIKSSDQTKNPGSTAELTAVDQSGAGQSAPQLRVTCDSNGCAQSNVYFLRDNQPVGAAVVINQPTQVNLESTGKNAGDVPMPANLTAMEVVNGKSRMELTERVNDPKIIPLKIQGDVVSTDGTKCQPLTTNANDIDACLVGNAEDGRWIVRLSGKKNEQPIQTAPVATPPPASVPPVAPKPNQPPKTPVPPSGPPATVSTVPKAPLPPAPKAPAPPSASVTPSKPPMAQTLPQANSPYAKIIGDELAKKGVEVWANYDGSDKASRVTIDSSEICPVIPKDPSNVVAEAVHEACMNTFWTKSPEYKRAVTIFKKHSGVSSSGLERFLALYEKSKNPGNDQKAKDFATMMNLIVKDGFSPLFAIISQRESDFDGTAVGPTGDLGWWQIISSTATGDCGLHVIDNQHKHHVDTRDERTQIVPSTKCALTLIKNSLKIRTWNNNFTLALASYNVGAHGMNGGVKKILEGQKIPLAKQKEYPNRFWFWFDFYHGKEPVANARSYVVNYLYAAMIALAPQHYNYEAKPVKP